MPRPTRLGGKRSGLTALLSGHASGPRRPAARPAAPAKLSHDAGDLRRTWPVLNFGWIGEHFDLMVGKLVKIWFGVVTLTFRRHTLPVSHGCVSGSSVQNFKVAHYQNSVHLVASHCKPWRDSSNEERLDGENGLLLTPSIDHLFDRGFIGFEDSGDLIVSPVAHRPSLQRMGVETQQVVNVGGFTEGQRRFLDFHRDKVVLRPAAA